MELPADSLVGQTAGAVHKTRNQGDFMRSTPDCAKNP